jgi:uncharacterized membrane protein YgcG
MSEPERSAEQMVSGAHRWPGHADSLPNHSFPGSGRGGSEPLANSFRASDTLTALETNPAEESRPSAAPQAVAKPHRRALLPLVIIALPAVWAVGTAAMLLRLITGMLIARWMVQRSVPINQLSSARHGCMFLMIKKAKQPPGNLI